LFVSHTGVVSVKLENDSTPDKSQSVELLEESDGISHQNSCFGRKQAMRTNNMILRRNHIVPTYHETRHIPNTWRAT